MIESEELVEIFHELKNPLAIIKINMELLKELHKSNFNVNFDTIENEILKIDNIIKRYLSYSEQKHLCKDLVYFKDVILNIIEENRLSYPDVTFEVIDKDEVSISAFEYHIYMIFSNIIKNSIDAMNGVGHIKINIFDKEGVATIETTDSGYGITEYELSKLNEGKFTSKPLGSGIGTSVIKNIINIYNGNFYLAKSDIIGTKAIVEMPVSNK